MAKIFLLRHAESEFNAGNKEVLDAPLTEVGKQQAAALTGHYDKVLCSTLTRAQQTLHLSKITYDTLEMSEELREHRTDNCDFLPHEEVVFETEEDLLKRVAKLPQIIQDFSKDVSKVLLVGHCDTFWYLMSFVKDGERFGKHLKNAEVIEWDGLHEASQKFKD